MLPIQDWPEELALAVRGFGEQAVWREGVARVPTARIGADRPSRFEILGSQRRQRGRAGAVAGAREARG